jgi:hypothetical protein
LKRRSLHPPQPLCSLRRSLSLFLSRLASLVANRC